jgi:hypothetical protein
VIEAVEQIMTTPWPNAAVATLKDGDARLYKRTPLTQAEIARAYLAHAQMMLGVGLFQFLMIMVSQPNSVERIIGFERSEATNQYSVIVTSFVWLCVLVNFLAIGWCWIQGARKYDRENLFQVSQQLEPKGWGRFVPTGAFITFSVFVVSGVFALRWLGKQPGIPPEVYFKVSDVLLNAATLTLASSCIVFASFRIKQAIHIGLSQKDAT